MPYSSVAEAESKNPAIKDLPSKGKSVWVRAFNSAKESGKDDASAAKIAWTAVARAGFKKTDENGWMLMSDIEKATIAIDGDNIAFGVPFTKIDIKSRTVEGFATLDNIDKSGEVVDFAASKEAFSDWIGNIREMHGPKAVGKAVSIEERKFEKDGTSFNGIWVKSKISKGAQDTWEKILDGTLSGYSIGGKVLERKPEVLKSDDRFSRQVVHRITKYHLGELSVVDNPMNALALFADIEKSDGTSIIKYDNGELKLSDVVIEDKGLFYCETCDVAKTDDVDASTIECVTCDGMMAKIGQVTEAPGLTELKKMVDAYFNKTEEVVEEKTEEDVEKSEPGQPVDAEEVFSSSSPEEPDVQENLAKPVPSLDTQKTVGEVETEKGRVIVTWMGDEYSKDEEAEFIEAILTPEDYKAVTNAHKTPPKGKPSDRSQYADPENYKYPLDTPSRVRAAMVYFNHSGQRQAGGYSMSKWAQIGKKIASAANKAFGSGHSYSNGKIITKVEDLERGELLIDLQKNNTSVNNNIVDLLKSLVNTLSKDDSPDIQGGETQTLEIKDLGGKILDILEVASGEIRDVLKAFDVQSLNSEDASGPTVGSDPGEAGVGTVQENDGGETWAASEVTVADSTGLPAADAGPDKVVPDAISTDGTGDASLEGVSADSGPEKVLPHAVLKSEETEEVVETENDSQTESEDSLLKSVIEKIDKKFDEVAERLDTIEKTGSSKKSSEVADDNLTKAETSIWSGAFYSGEFG